MLPAFRTRHREILERMGEGTSSIRLARNPQLSHLYGGQLCLCNFYGATYIV